MSEERTVAASGRKQRAIWASLKKPPVYWEKKGRETALWLYAFAKEHVPAYRQFTAGSPEHVRTMRQFETLPLTTKDSYLRAYPYTDLFPRTGLLAATTVSATSGSTGEPFFFPRGPEHDRMYERALEVLLKNQWQAAERSTLAMIGFALGIWIGGVFTYKNLNSLAERGLPMTIIPIGAQRDLYLKAFQKFAPHFEQVILMGYPPFIKDLLEFGAQTGVDWQAHRIRILTAAEGYSEAFRNRLAELTGADPVRDIVNIYGTVEQGTIAHETALANMIRRLASERSDIFKALFPDALNIPTLAQYYPDQIYFEAVKGQIVATSYGSSIPLVRYAFNDLGGVIPFNAMEKKLSSLGVDLAAEMRKYGIEGMALPLPFVYVHARADFSIVFRGANIYPEEIRAALDSKVFEQQITGRFSAIRKESDSLDQMLEINVELRPAVAWSDALGKKLTEHIMAELREHNSEYAYLFAHEPEKVAPSVIGRSYGDPAYFNRDGKQRWVRT